MVISIIPFTAMNADAAEYYSQRIYYADSIPNYLEEIWHPDTGKAVNANGDLVSSTEQLPAVGNVLFENLAVEDAVFDGSNVKVIKLADKNLPLSFKMANAFYDGDQVAVNKAKSISETYGYLNFDTALTTAKDINGNSLRAYDASYITVEYYYNSTNADFTKYQMAFNVLSFNTPAGVVSTSSKLTAYATENIVANQWAKAVIPLAEAAEGTDFEDYFSYTTADDITFKQIKFYPCGYDNSLKNLSITADDEMYIKSITYTSYDPEYPPTKNYTLKVWNSKADNDNPFDAEPLYTGSFAPFSTYTFPEYAEYGNEIPEGYKFISYVDSVENKSYLPGDTYTFNGRDRTVYFYALFSVPTAIEFYVSEGNSFSNNYYMGDTITLPAAPEVPESMSGKTFVGWTEYFGNTAGNTYSAGAQYLYEKNVTFKAKFLDPLYVASTGSDSGAGTAADPYRTLDKAYSEMKGASGTIVVMDELDHWLLETAEGAYAVNTIALAEGQTLTITGKDPATGSVYSGAAITRSKAGRAAVSSGKLVLEHITDVPFGGAWGSKFIRAQGNGSLTLGTGYKTVSTGTEVEFNGGDGDIELNLDGAINHVRFVDWGPYSRTGDITINIGKNATFYNSPIAICFGGDFSNNSIVNIDGNVFVNVDGATPSNGKILFGGNAGFTGAEKLTVTGVVQILLKETTMYTEYYNNASSMFSSGATYVVTAGDIPTGCDVVSTAPGYITITSTDDVDAFVNGVKVEDGVVALTAENSNISFEMPGVIPNTYFVSSTGSDDNHGRTSGAPYATLDKAYTSLGSASGKIVVMDELDHWLLESATGEYAANAISLANGQTLTITGKDPATGTVYPNAAITRTKSGRVNITNGTLVLENITDKLGNGWSGPNKFFQISGNGAVTLGEGYIRSDNTEVEFGAGTGNLTLDINTPYIQTVRFIDWGDYTYNGDVTINVGEHADFSTDATAAIVLGGSGNSDAANGNTVRINGNIFINVNETKPSGKKTIIFGSENSFANFIVTGVVQVLLKETTMVVGNTSFADKYNAAKTYVVSAENIPDGCDVVTKSAGVITLKSAPGYQPYVNGVAVSSGDFTLTAENSTITFEEFNETVIPNTYFVSASGSDTNLGVTASSPYATLDKAYSVLNGESGTIVVMDALNHWLLETADGQYAVNTVALADGQTITITGKDPVTGNVYPNAAIARARAGRTAVSNGHLVLEYLTDVAFGGTWGSKFIRAEGKGSLTLGAGYNTTNPGAQVEFGAGNGDIEVNVDGAVDVVRFADWGAYDRTGDITINIGKNASFYNATAAVSFGGDLSNNSVININGDVFVNVDGATPTMNKILFGGYTGMNLTGAEKVTINGTVQVLLKETTMVAAYHADAQNSFDAEKVYVVSVNDIPEGCDVVTKSAGVITITVAPGYNAFVNGVKVSSGDFNLTDEDTTVGFAIEGTLPYTYFVASTGNDSNNGLTANTPFATLDKAYAQLGTASGTIVVMDELNHWLDETEAAGQYNSNDVTLAVGQKLTITGKNPITNEVYQNAALTRNCGRIVIHEGTLVLEYVAEKHSASIANWNSTFFRIKNDANLTLGDGYHAESAASEIEFSAGTGNVELNVNGPVNVVRFVDYETYARTGNITINIGKNANFFNYSAAVCLGGDFGDGTAKATINGDVFVNVDGATPTGNNKNISLGGYYSSTTGKVDVNGTVQVLLKNTTMTATKHADAHTYEADNTYIVTANNVPEGCDVVTKSAGVITLTVGTGFKAYVNGAEVQAGDVQLTQLETTVEFASTESLEMKGVQFRVASGETAQAIRFIASFPKSVQSVYSDALEFGMVLIPTSALGSEELVVGGTYGGYNAAICVATKWHDDNHDSYNACLTGILEENYDTEVTARPYIKVSETEYVYGDSLSASITSAAQAALNAHNNGTVILSAEELSVVNGILGN